MLNAGIVEDLKEIFENKGVAQGSVLSPFLFNVYMHELDKFVVNLQKQAGLTQKEYVSGTYGNPEAEANYRSISREFGMDRWRVSLAKYGTPEKVLAARRKAYKDHHDKYGRRKGVDPENRHIHYVRYADDFLIGIVGSRHYALQLRKDINNFIKGNLHLEVKKDSIVHRNDKESVIFLSHKIRLQEFKAKFNTVTKRLRAIKQHKKKSVARFEVVNKRLSRAKSANYRANILKEVGNICEKFNLNAKKENTSYISQIAAYRAVTEQIAKRLNFNNSKDFLELISSTDNINSKNELNNSALSR